MIKNPISYPGNKNRLAKQIINLLPSNISTLVEPFCGSAVISANAKCKKIILNDNNKYILEILKYQYKTSFKTIVKDIENIIDIYGFTYSRNEPKGKYKEVKHEGLSIYNKKAYEKLKQDYNSDHDVKKLFVLLIYGFNHYLRFNNKNMFNVPVGKVDFSQSIYNDLKEFESIFIKKKINFSNYDYLNKNLYKDIKAFYYFDPPYLITKAPYNSFWNTKNEYDLLALLDKLSNKGIKFALSNVILSNGKENVILKEWMKKYNVHYLKRQYRNANYQKVNITDTIEVLITNY